MIEIESIVFLTLSLVESFVETIIVLSEPPVVVLDDTSIVCSVPDVWTEGMLCSRTVTNMSVIVLLSSICEE